MMVKRKHGFSSASGLCVSLVSYITSLCLVSSLVGLLPINTKRLLCLIVKMSSGPIQWVFNNSDHKIAPAGVRCHLE
jgi:hypothetical protein